MLNLNTKNIYLIKLRKIHQDVDLEFENKNLKELLNDKGKISCNYCEYECNNDENLEMHMKKDHRVTKLFM